MAELLSRALIAYQRHSWRNFLLLIAYNVWWEIKTRMPRRFRRSRRGLSFDERYGTDTGGAVAVIDFQVPADRAVGANHYEPVSEQLFGKIMKSMGGGSSVETFIDFGSGKGRQLLLASEYPFRRIIGVELEPNLHQVALQNIALYRSNSQKCLDIVSVCADATELELPPDPLVCSFYNPFGYQVLMKVVRNVERSLEERPRVAKIVYLNPVHRDVFDHSPVWEHVHTSIFSGFVLYRWRGAGS